MCFGKAALENRSNNTTRFLFDKETEKASDYGQCGHTHGKAC